MPNGILRFSHFDSTDICPWSVPDHVVKGDAMADTGSAQRRGRFRFPVLAAAALALFFVQVWTQVDPRLIHHRQHPVYLLGWEFFVGHLDGPGRPAEYARALLAQLHWLGWPGAVLLTLLVGGVVLLTRALLAGMGRRADVLPVVPVVFLTVLTNQYEHPMTTTIGLLAALAAANAYVWVTPRHLWLRTLLFVVLATALHYAAAGPMLLFAVVAAIHALLAVGRRNPTVGSRLVGVAYLAVGAAVPWAASAWLFIVAPAEAFTRHLPFMAARDIVSLAAAICLYAFFPAAAVWAAWPRKAADAEPAGPKGAVGRALALGRRTVLGWATASVTLLAVWTVLALGTLNGRERSLLYLDYHVAHGRWEDVLAEAARIQTSNSNTVQGITLALCHTGQLLEEMFSYPLGMDREAPPALRAFYEDVKYDRVSESLLALGRVNEAEHIAHEALEIMGEQPTILKRLAVINVVKGEPAAARRFLGVLDKTLWHREWAGRWRSKLDADPSLSTEPRIRHLRRLMPTADRIAPATSEEACLYLLQADPGNRMAFERLMLHYLLKRQPSRLVENLGRIRHVTYPHLPRLLEEAVLIHVQQNRIRRVNLYGHAVRPETLRRHQEFLRRRQRHTDDPEGAWNALKDDFGNTYWFFYVFGCTPVGRSGPPLARKEGPDT